MATKFRQDLLLGPNGSPAVKSDVDQAGDSTNATEVDNIVAISQTDYDAIGTKDPHTVYIITS